MSDQTPGFSPLNCNPHHELLAVLRRSLAESSSGDRERLFESRERLGELTACIDDGPWGILSGLTNAVQVMLGHLLRRGNLDGPEAMQVATEIMTFVDSALSLAPPTGGERHQREVARKLVPEAGGHARSLKLQVTPEIGRTAPSPDPAAEHHSGTRFGHLPGADQSAGELGRVAYQMVNESRLGELLIKMGCLRPRQLDRALVLQKLSRKRLGEVLMAMEVVDLSALQAALDMQRQETLRFTAEHIRQVPDNGNDQTYGRVS